MRFRLILSVMAALVTFSACGPERAREAAPKRTKATTQEEAVPAREAGHSDEAGAWCGGHGVPEAFCTKCNPSLIPVFQAKNDYCAEHQLPESVCPQCGHGLTPPKPAEVPAGEMCAEHGVPEAFCTKCNPSLIPVFKAKNDWCAEHELPESVCPICRGTAPSGATGAGPDGAQIQFANQAIAGEAGIETSRAIEADHSPQVTASCRIVFDPARVARVNARASGVVTSLAVQVGDHVTRGETLAVLRSAEVAAERAGRAAARAHLAAAEAEIARVETLSSQGLSSTRESQLAQQELASAEAEVDAASARLAEFGAENGEGAEYALRSPVAGWVTLRAATVGEALPDEAAVFEVVDPSRVVAELSISESDLERVAIGRAVSISIPSLSGEYRGTIESLAPMVDPATRTAIARVALDNPRGELRANLFGTARIDVGSVVAGVTVPRAAVQEVEHESYVFVRTAVDRFVARRVALAEANGDLAWITSGIKSGEEVATTGSFLLKTEVMKESIGAGCCDVD